MFLTKMNCDGCKYYRWYYDHCDKWDCKVNEKEVHNCFEQYATPIRDTMVCNLQITKISMHNSIFDFEEEQEIL